MTKIRKLTVIFILSGMGHTAHTQEKDFGIWYSLAVEKKVAKNLDFESDINLRTYHDAGEIEEGFIDVGLKYKINKTFSSAFTYRFTERMEKDDNFHPRHKWVVDFRAKKALGDLDVSGRLRFQQRFKTYFRDENDREPKEHLRFRIKAVYDIPKCPLNPYASSELFFPVFYHVKKTIDQQRYTAGFEYNVSKKQSLEIEYIFQRDLHPKPTDMNIISLNYNIKL